MQKRKISFIIILFVFALVLSFACGTQRKDSANTSSATSAADKLSRSAYNILDQHCGECHGDGKPQSALVRIALDSHDELIGKSKIVPGNAEKSLIFERIAYPKNYSEPMPPAFAKTSPPLSPDEQNVLRDWISEGASDWRGNPQGNGHFISNEVVFGAIQKDLSALDRDTRRLARYFTLTNLYNTNDPDIDAYRNGLSKLVNSLSTAHDIIKPVAIDTDKTIYRILLSDYNWDDKTWKLILASYPYAVQYRDVNFRTMCSDTQSSAPFIRGDWFITHAALAPLYDAILKLPETDAALERQQGISVNDDLVSFPGKKVMRAGFMHSGVSNSNRVVERHLTRDGAYWKSYDFDSTEDQHNPKTGRLIKHNIIAHPLDFERSGGEIIFNLPNGLQAYMLVRATGQKLAKAPTNIVFNKEIKFKNGGEQIEVRNALSCMSCHSKGMRDFTDEVSPASRNGNLPVTTEEDVHRLYVEPAVMKDAVDHDRATFTVAVRNTGANPDTEDPIGKLSEQFEGNVDLLHAASEVGLPSDDFQQRLHDKLPMLSPEIGQLLNGVPIARGLWETDFGTIISILNIGDVSRKLVSATPNPKPMIAKKSAVPTMKRPSAKQAITPNYYRPQRTMPRRAHSYPTRVVHSSYRPAYHHPQKHYSPHANSSSEPSEDELQRQIKRELENAH